MRYDIMLLYSSCILYWCVVFRRKARMRIIALVNIASKERIDED